MCYKSNWYISCLCRFQQLYVICRYYSGIWTRRPSPNKVNRSFGALCWWQCSWNCWEAGNKRATYHTNKNSPSSKSHFKYCSCCLMSGPDMLLRNLMISLSLSILHLKLDYGLMLNLKQPWKFLLTVEITALQWFFHNFVSLNMQVT